MKISLDCVYHRCVWRYRGSSHCRNHCEPQLAMDLLYECSHICDYLHCYGLSSAIETYEATIATTRIASHGLARVSIFLMSTTSLLIGHLFGGTVFAWNSWHTILPLLLGILGLTIFGWWENSRFCSEPAIPGRLFGNRTSVAGFAMIFLQSGLTTWNAFEWPIYFQGVRQTSPLSWGQLHRFRSLSYPSRRSIRPASHWYGTLSSHPICRIWTLDTRFWAQYSSRCGR